jgi:C_GCAxxG_C_C family probable redox protein
VLKNKEYRELLKRVRRKAQDYDKYSGCSQSVLLSLQEEFKIGGLESFKAATVLSGGIARRGETCGALIGALMALGLVIGRETMDETLQYRATMHPANDLCQRFQTALQTEFHLSGELKSTLCRDIHKKLYGRAFNLNDKTEYQAFLDAGGHSDTGCPKVCGIAAQLGAALLNKLQRTHVYSPSNSKE